jgi:FkbM family methyltransferase
LYTLLLAKLVGSDGKVHSFEPEEKNYRRLLTNIAINGFSNIRANHSAVFSESKLLHLNVFPESVNSWHSLARPELPDPWNPDKTIVPETIQEVPGVSLDDYCADQSIEIIDFLKIDVEGAELDVLYGASRLLTDRHIRCIQIEISHPQVAAMGHQPNDVFKMLVEHNFKVYTIEESGELYPITALPDQRYINLIALSI